VCGARQPNFPEAQSGIFANLIRWYDFLSHTADAANIVPKVKITKAPFRMPPPPALAPKASAPLPNQKRFERAMSQLPCNVGGMTT